ncbi:MAG: hypothetical protein JO283_14110 [Bradyrhizobium sp.]|nr:hypothetical protein [Bradyrhizobium sp.]
MTFSLFSYFLFLLWPLVALKDKQEDSNVRGMASDHRRALDDGWSAFCRQP